MKKSKTARGFTHFEFTDSYGQKCSLQNSSNSVPHVWLGVDNTGPHIDGPNGSPNEQVSCRMHVNLKLARQLVKKLQKFIDEGYV